MAAAATEANQKTDDKQKMPDVKELSKKELEAKFESLKPLFYRPAGFAPPIFFELANRRKAMMPLGTTQHIPPSTAENIAALPPSSPAITPATSVAIICRETKRSIFLFFSRQPWWNRVTVW